MNSFFYPKSIAIFGVSDSPTNLAGTIIHNLDRFGYSGKVYPVGISGGFLGNRRIYRSIDEIEEAPELAVFLIPAKHVPDTLDACGRRGVRSVILESSGFSELSDESKTVEKKLLNIAAQWGMRFVGPNCFGAINMDNGLVLPFFHMLPERTMAGGVSLISQSGGILFDTCMLSTHEKIGLNKLISVGNKLMTNENDCLEYLIADDHTQVIGLYLESFSDGRRFMDLASSTEKPIVLLKSNRGETGRQIAKFHTAALAGDDAVADAAMRQAGVHRVRSMREMVDLFKVFRLPLLRGQKIAIVSRSGGHGVLAADAVERYGLELAHYSDGFFDMVKELKANVIRTTNPLDVGDVYEGDSFKKIIRGALNESDAAGVLFNFTFNVESDAGTMRELIQYTMEQNPVSTKPVVFCLPSNKYQWYQMEDRPDYPVFGDVDGCLLALRRSFRHTLNETARTRNTHLHRAHSIGTGSTRKGQKRLMEPDALLELLKEYGISVAPYAVVKTSEEAIMAARTIGYPVALKAASPEILHKTDQGAVRLGIADDQMLAETIKQMPATPYLVQKMVRKGLEVILGAKRDPEFGHVLLFGLGGIFAELFKDTAIRVTPVDASTAAEMLTEIRGAAMFEGFRGRVPLDTLALTTVITGISRLLSAHPEISFIDINPLIVFDKGHGCIVVDAKAEKDK